MLKPTQCSLELMNKARRMSRYSAAHIEMCLVDQNQVNSLDAKAIVSIVKQMQALERFPGAFQRPFDIAWRSDLLPEFVVKQLVEEFAISAPDAASITVLARQLSDLDYDFTNRNPAEPMMGFA